MTDLIKSVSTGYEPEKRFVKNTKKVDYTRDNKLWAVGSVIEVDEKEADELHKEGFLVMDELEPEPKIEINKEVKE